MKRLANILIINCREELFSMFAAALDSAELSLWPVRSEEELLKVLPEREFAVVLVDAGFPEAGKVLAGIRQRRGYEATPFILFSAGDEAGESWVGDDVELADRIVLPIDEKILAGKVMSYVRLHELVEQAHRSAAEQAAAVREQAARTSAETAQLTYSFLADASRRFASTRDGDDILGKLSRVAVPFLADACLITVPAGRVSGHPREYLNILPEHAQKISDRHAREGPVLHECMAEVFEKVIRTGRPIRCGQVSAEELEKTTSRAELRVVLQSFGLSSFFVAPLKSRGATFGAAAYLRARPFYFFTEADVRLAEELTLRASQAYENARLGEEAREARREADRAHRARDEFLSMLTHELRTPLTPVLNAVADIEETKTCEGEAREALRMIRRNVELEARLIDDLLDVTGLSENRNSSRFQMVDAHQIVNQAIDLLSEEIQARNLDLSLELDATRHRLRGDPGRLQRIFLNLIKNAIKFTPPKGAIEIFTSNPRPEEFCFEVRDNGIGIEPGMLPRIFNAFEQGHSTELGGLGLGLAICKSLVALHRGSIAAYSAGLGQGATFRVALPISQSIHSEPPAEKPATAIGVSGRRILLVEDHEDTKRSLQRLLKRRGYEVRVASNIASALEIARSYRFELLVSDIGLPDGTGMDLVRLLKRRNPDFKAIAISGFGMDEDIRRSKAEGFQGHLTKPVNIKELEEQVASALSAEPPMAPV